MTTLQSVVNTAALAPTRADAAPKLRLPSACKAREGESNYDMFLLWTNDSNGDEHSGVDDYMPSRKKGFLKNPSCLFFVLALGARDTNLTTCSDAINIIT